MMKTPNPMNVERQAQQTIRNFLTHLPKFDIDHVDEPNPDTGIDLIVEGRFAGRPITLVIEIKASGQPRNVRDAAGQLHRYLRKGHPEAVPIFVAPYLSPQARETCREEQIGYLDFMGNTLIAFDTVYIEREVPGRPEPERRALRSLYKPKSARILRALLVDPGRSWRTTDLADTAKVSAGLVSTVGTKLRERGWAEQTHQGLALTDAKDLLDNWATDYEPPQIEEHRCYTTLHGDMLLNRLYELSNRPGRVALASFSAAEWLAPFVRHPNTYFYADEAGLASLQQLLDLKEVAQGGNVVVLVPDEDGVLDDARPLSNGLIATSPVQTYLDLMQAGDRGQEGAAHLRTQLLEWPA